MTGPAFRSRKSWGESATRSCGAAGPRRGTGASRQRPGYEGMGLGLFIAKTLLERTGATLAFGDGREAPRQRPEGRQGAVVELSWDREDICTPLDAEAKDST